MSQSGHVVNVYHYLDKDMGHPVNGVQSCAGNDNLVCEWHSAKNMSILHSFLQNDTEKFWRSNDNRITVFVANIHQWLGDRHSALNLCEFPVNLTMADTEGGWVDSSVLMNRSFSPRTSWHAQSRSLTHTSVTLSLTHTLIHSRAFTYSTPYTCRKSETSNMERRGGHGERFRCFQHHPKHLHSAGKSSHSLSPSLSSSLSPFHSNISNWTTLTQHRP